MADVQLRRPPDIPLYAMRDLPEPIRNWIVDVNYWQTEVWKFIASEGVFSHKILADIGDLTHDEIDDFVENQEAVTITAVALTLDATHRHVEVTAAVTITLPTAVGIAGKDYIIDSNHAGDTTVVPNGSETIEGETSQTVPTQSSMTVYSDGSNWRIK